jgi:hypothetical protein
MGEVANLYIDGSDFYRGSTRKLLKNGWCDFRIWGEKLAPKHLGPSIRIGKSGTRPGRTKWRSTIRRSLRGGAGAWRQCRGVTRLGRSTRVLHGEAGDEARGKVFFRRKESAVGAARPSEKGLREQGFRFTYEITERDIHDRTIETENWRIILGRGLDTFDGPAGQQERRTKASYVT